MENHLARLKNERGAWRIVSCSCGWQIPTGTSDSDVALAEHVAINTINQCGRTVVSKTAIKFDGVKVFCATTIQQRAEIGDQVTAWLKAARARHGFQLVDYAVRQSSDSAFHLVSISLFYKESLTPQRSKEKPRG